MTWIWLDNWIVITGALCAVACALPGCFLLLRGMSMMGDAISHAVLPGLAAAFVITQSRSSATMFVAAAVVGVLTAVFTHWVSSFGRVDRGAAMGIVFTTLFAMGLLLIVRAADTVDLDPGCVLYGAIELTPLDAVARVEVAGDSLLAGPAGWLGEARGGVVRVVVPRAAAVLAGVLIANLLLIVLLFKEFRISSFDPGLANTLGLNATVMHYLLMTMVAVTTVASFEAVGSIIVIAMLIVPAATAFLLTRRLWTMLVISAAVGAGSSLLGHAGAIYVPGWLGFDSGTATSSSGMMAAAAGLIFALAWLLAPGEGVFSGGLRRARSMRRRRLAASKGGQATALEV